VKVLSTFSTGRSSNAFMPATSWIACMYM
jgi:hypothetical protein